MLRKHKLVEDDAPLVSEVLSLIDEVWVLELILVILERTSVIEMEQVDEEVLPVADLDVLVIETNEIDDELEHMLLLEVEDELGLLVVIEMVHPLNDEMVVLESVVV